MPRWRPSWAADRAVVPTTAPRDTSWPARTLIVASGMCVTRHGPQRSVTMPPLEPIRPANATGPVHAALTGAPGAAARSTPRWRPASNGRPGSNPRVTSPGTGAASASRARTNMRRGYVRPADHPRAQQNRHEVGTVPFACGAASDRVGRVHLVTCIQRDVEVVAAGWRTSTALGGAVASSAAARGTTCEAARSCASDFTLFLQTGSYVQSGAAVGAPDFTFLLQTGSYVHLGAAASTEMHVLIPDGSFRASRAGARAEMHETCRAASLPSKQLTFARHDAGR